MTENKIDRSTPIPLYYQIKNILLNEITTGVYNCGSRIPTEYELQEKYGVSRSTIRQAVTELANEGWLVRKPSKGTFVSRPDISRNLFRSFEPFYRRVHSSGKIPQTEVIEMGVIEATDFLASVMNLSVGDKVVSMFRRRFINAEAVVTVRNCLPFSTCDFILSHDFKTESLYEVLMSNPETRIKETKTVVSAEKAKPEDITLLSVKPDCPMLVFNNTAIAHKGYVVDFATYHYRGDKNNFEITSRTE